MSPEEGPLRSNISRFVIPRKCHGKCGEVGIEVRVLDFQFAEGRRDAPDLAPSQSEPIITHDFRHYSHSLGQPNFLQGKRVYIVQYRYLHLHALLVKNGHQTE